MMISFGGVIGTGLFLSTGYTVNQTGPVGTILAYGVGAVIVYLVMLCLGELSVAMPFTGAFHVYATSFIGAGPAQPHRRRAVPQGPRRGVHDDARGELRLLGRRAHRHHGR